MTGMDTHCMHFIAAATRERYGCSQVRAHQQWLMLSPSVLLLLVEM